MSHVLRSEWIKFRTVRAHLVLVTIAALFPVAIVTLVAVFSPDPEASRGQDIVDLTVALSVVSVLLLGSLSVINLTSEYSHNTIRVSYAAVPARWRVVVGKALIGTLVTFAVISFTWWGGWLVGWSILRGRGAGTAMSLGALDRPVVQYVTMMALAVIVSWFALGIGTLIRNSPASVVMVLLWPLLIENLASLALALAGLDGAGRWMPYTAAIGAVGSAPIENADQLGRPWAQLYFAACSIGLLAVGVVLDRRRDA